MWPFKKKQPTPVKKEKYNIGKCTIRFHLDQGLDRELEVVGDYFIGFDGHVYLSKANEVAKNIIRNTDNFFKFPNDEYIAVHTVRRITITPLVDYLVE